MMTILTDHGKILHWAGAHHLFPVRGAGGADDVSFAAPGELEGRLPIGWNEFFPALARSGKTVVADDEAGTLSVLAAATAQADATSGDATKQAH